jgi:hypothetical protein
VARLGLDALVIVVALFVACKPERRERHRHAVRGRHVEVAALLVLARLLLQPPCVEHLGVDRPVRLRDVRIIGRRERVGPLQERGRARQRGQRPVEVDRARALEAVGDALRDLEEAVGLHAVEGGKATLDGASQAARGGGYESVRGRHRRNWTKESSKDLSLIAAVMMTSRTLTAISGGLLRMTLSAM